MDRFLVTRFLRCAQRELAHRTIAGVMTFACWASLASAQDVPELHQYLMQANQAQLVMFADKDLLPKEQIQTLAGGLREIIEQQRGLESPTLHSYMAIEGELTKRVGSEASNLHLGRSNNDLGETINRMYMRALLLDVLDAIAVVRSRLHDLSEEHVETVIPGLTHAVQAQPTTLAHLLLAMDSGLSRDSERLQQVHDRVNLSPLGCAAFTTSGFDFDRTLLAELLGFPALLENGYDAIMVSAADSKVEFATTIGLSALGVGRFIQYVLFQYDDPSPGIYVEGDIVSRSSIMPQKRNPSALERLRLRASEVVANGQAATFFVHNTPMYEVKDIREDHLIRTDRFAKEALDMYSRLDEVLKSLTIRKDVLLDQVERDYATMTELADTLHRRANLPYRQGYAVASELTTYGRLNNKRPLDITAEEFDAVCVKVTGKPSGISEQEFLAAVDPYKLISNRKGRGGPQPAETKRMLADQRSDLESVQQWVSDHREHLQKSEAQLQARFDGLADAGQ